MQSQMMNGPLLISALIEHAERYHCATSIASVETDSGIKTTNWGEVAGNAPRFASALTATGPEPQTRCGTIAWNNRRRLEIYLGVSGAGFGCHAINPRLFPEQLVYIIIHARDEALLRDGWFAAGDVATIDPDCFLTIRDGSKDIIKSGGEWISSVEPEYIAIVHPQPADPAVIGVRHRNWDERPILVGVKAAVRAPTETNQLEFFDGKIARWQAPYMTVITEELPRNTAGKVPKQTLREQFSAVPGVRDD